MILVTRFVAEAIAEAIAEDANDDDIIIDNDECIEVNVRLSELDIDEISAYVAHQYGDQGTAQDDIESSFGKHDMASQHQTTIYWEA